MYVVWPSTTNAQAYDLLYMFGDFRHAAKFAIELHMGEVRHQSRSMSHAFFHKRKDPNIPGA